MKRFLMAAATASVFIALPTTAAIYSSASLTNFRLELTDLNLEDGITPSVIFAHTISSQTSGGVQFFGAIEDDISIQDYFYQKGGFNKVLSGTVSDSLSTASAYYETSDNFGISYQVSGSTAANNELGVYGGYISSSLDVLNFTLSPNSQLQIFADSNVFLETTSDGFPNYGFSKTFFRADEFYGQYNSIVPIDYASSEFTASLNKPETLSELTTLSILIGNTSSEDLFGLLIYGAGNSGYADYDYPEIPSTETPVPAALPLMASALGLFGLLRRKNKVASI